MTATVPALSVSADNVTDESADENYFPGDVDGDGKVTVLDVTTIRRALVLLITPSYNEKAAEVTVECTYDLEAFAEYAKNQTYTFY